LDQSVNLPEIGVNAQRRRSRQQTPAMNPSDAEIGDGDPSGHGVSRRAELVILDRQRQLDRGSSNYEL
jgi:hypothetical protein